jgi:predicted transcriptional regulator
MTAREDVAFLVGSECRVETLRVLDGESLRPSRLAERVSCARETAQRNLAGFVDRDWVEKSEGTYRLTAAGRMVLEQYESLESTVESAQKLRVLLANVGDAADAVDPELLARQTVTTASPENPHAPIDRWLDIVAGGVDSYYGVAPIVSRVFNEAAADAIGEDTEMELVIDESVLETSREEFQEALQRAFELDQFTLWVAPRELDYGLAVSDGHVWLAAYDDLGNVVASVDGDEDRFVEWATDSYRSLRAQSDRADPQSLSRS